MTSPSLSQSTRKDIDTRAKKILKALGNPEPPLDLRVLRDLLELDKAYYSSSDDGLLRETISRLSIAGQQVLKRPSLILDAVRKFSLQALYLPDQKRILLDADSPVLKHRWNEAHEIGHSVLPWHADFLHGDNLQTLTPHCHTSLEGEANHVAGQLLFLGDRFRAEAADSEICFETVVKLGKAFGNTISSTLWRFVEEAHPQLPLVGLVSPHPHHSLRSGSFDPLHPGRHMMRSAVFAEKFADVTDFELFACLEQIARPQKAGIVGSDEIVLTDGAGDRHIFRAEIFFNRYDALSLAWYDRKVGAIVTTG